MRWPALVAAVLCLLACGGTAQPGPETVGDVSLHVTGGFTGWDRTVVVARDGTVTLTVGRGPSPSGTAAHMDAQTLLRLHRLVSDPAFAALAAEYPGPSGGADMQRYEVTAQVAGKTVSSAAWDGASAPQILSDVISILAGVLNQATT